MLNQVVVVGRLNHTLPPYYEGCNMEIILDVDQQLIPIVIKGDMVKVLYDNNIDLGRVIGVNGKLLNDYCEDPETEEIISDVYIVAKKISFIGEVSGGDSNEHE